MKNTNFTKKLIEMALLEDVGDGDITSEAIIGVKSVSTAAIQTKQDIILAGIDIAIAVFKKIDRNIVITAKKRDGDAVGGGNVIATVKGGTKNLLAAERTALNFLQHLSGIATYTGLFVRAIEGTGAKILDTRKTTPAYRSLEKYAVRMGGGQNHRIGLYDRYLIKDNHVFAAGSIVEAVNMVMRHRRKSIPVEVEVKTIEELRQILNMGIDIVMLDNFSVTDVKKAVEIVNPSTLRPKDRSMLRVDPERLSFPTMNGGAWGRRGVKRSIKLEVSGNIRPQNARLYALAGIDYISVGCITHSAPAADINMKFV